MRRTRMLAERFWDKADRSAGPDGCWLWTAALSHNGYGRFGNGDMIGTRQAHRIAYELVIGPIPAGLVIDHLCRNRRCVNPAHMEPVTTAENLRRGVGLAVENARKTHCPRGHAYDEANTYVNDNKRYCRACVRAASRRWKAQRQQVAA